MRTRDDRDGLYIAFYILFFPSFFLHSTTVFLCLLNIVLTEKMQKFQNLQAHPLQKNVDPLERQNISRNCLLSIFVMMLLFYMTTVKQAFSANVPNRIHKASQ